MTEIRILTVRQPWAHAILNLRKNVENRSRNIAGSYRGPVLIHAGKRMAPDDEPPVIANDAFDDIMRLGPVVHRKHFGHIIGVVDLVDVHRDCPPWEEDEVPWHIAVLGHELCTEWSQEGMWHLVLANPRLLPTPIRWQGALGLRRVDTTCPRCDGMKRTQMDAILRQECRECHGTGERFPGLEALL